MNKSVLLLISLWVFTHFATAQVIVDKVVKYGSGNPTLSIASYRGSAEARAALEGFLLRCDWFKVLPEGQAAQSRLTVKYDAEPEHSYTGQVVLGDNSRSFTLYAADGDLNMAAAKFVDQILYQLFKVPALCSRPVVYVRSGANGNKELFSCLINGSNIQRITHNKAISTEPAWGHAGALVYTLNQGTALNIVLLDVVNKRHRIVSRSRGLNSSPALSRDGSKLYVTLSFGQQVDLYEINLRDGSRRQLTNDRDVESSPCLSPDGTQLCFVSDRTGRPQLHLMPVHGGKARRMQLGFGESVSPDWTAITNRLCYATRTPQGQYVIAVVDMEKPGANPEIVTLAAGNWEAPSWAPDGRHIICTRKTGRNQELYIVDSWYKSFTQLTRGNGFSLPAWMPAR